jgi:hypothetical protein
MKDIIKLYFFCRRECPELTPVQCWVKACEIHATVDAFIWC